MSDLLGEFVNEMSLCGNEDACKRRFMKFNNNLRYNTAFSGEDIRKIRLNAINIYRTRIQQLRQGARGRLKRKTNKKKKQTHRRSRRFVKTRRRKRKHRRVK